MNEMSEERLKEWEGDGTRMFYLRDGHINEMTEEIRKLRAALASGIHLPEVDVYLNDPPSPGRYLCFVDIQDHEFCVLQEDALWHQLNSRDNHVVRAWGQIVLPKEE